MQCTLERSSLGVNIGCQSFTDLDYADDVALLAELLHFLTHGLEVMSEEASLLGLQMNGAKTNIQCIGDIDSVPQVVHVGSSQLEVVNEFTYLAACTTCDISSESEILRRIDIVRNCMALLEKHVWKSDIRVDTKVRLYQAYVLPVLVYGSEAWTITKVLARRLDAFDTWSFRNILRIPYTRHVTNASVGETTSCPPVSSITKTRWLHFFGHVARSDSRQDQQSAASALLLPQRDWRRP